jgi:hypothetical protein
MKNVCILFFLILFNVASAQIINFPDPNFKNALLLTKCVDSNSDNFADADADLNNDGEIDQSEALKVKNLDVSYKGVTNLEGINYFDSLINLNCSNNKLTNLDIQNFIFLKSLNCSFNYDLVNLKLDSLPNLNSLNCTKSNLKVLTLNNFPELKSITCSDNAFLETINLKNLPKLNSFSADGCRFSSLDFRDFKELTSFSCSNNLYLKELKLGILPKLKYMYVNSTSITALDLNDFVELITLRCEDNMFLEQLTLNNLPKLTEIHCSETGLISLTLSDLPELSIFQCSSVISLKNFLFNNLPKLTEFLLTGTSITSITFQNLNNLRTIECSANNSLSEITLENLPKLQSLSCSNSLIKVLELEDLPSFSSLGCSNTSLLKKLTLTNLPYFRELVCQNAGLESLEVKDFQQLVKVDCSSSYLLKSITLSNLPSLTELICRRTGLASLKLENLPKLSIVNCSSNSSLKELEINNLPKLSELDCSSTSLLSLEIKDFPLLSVITSSSNKSLTSLTLQNLPNLLTLICSQSNLSSLIIKDFPKLSYFSCNESYNLQSLVMEDLPKLSILSCHNTNLSSLDLNNLPELSELTFGSRRSLKELTLTKLLKVTKITCYSYGLNFLKVKSLPLLNYLRINNNFSSIKTLILDDLPKLKTFGYESSDSTEVIEIKNLPELTELSFYYNKLLKTLKIEDLPKIKKFTCFDSPVLKSIEIITESILTYVSFYNIPSLQYICCTDINFQLIEDHLKIKNIKNVYVTNYCSFDPFSDFGVVTGTVKFDADSNGCDEKDKNISGTKFDIVGPSNSGSYLFSGNTVYDISLNLGIHTITPQLEHVGFEFSPNSIIIDIQKNDTITQDFCIKPKGILRQTNITVIPLSPPARPGFDASYKIVWENVGNQIESGTLNFTYDETLLDYISATQTADQVADGIIKWNFSNLLPFEKREITVTLKVNRPTDTPAVNAGDKLYMTASILDNIFTLENTVVGSYDPNDKTCLQGDRVHPDMIGKYVDYLIRFENTGTYAAENVVVKDIIDTKRFDVSTLQITDASHEVYTRIEGNKVEFIFENIQLPFDDANNDGYIAFKIKTLSTLQLGDSLKNLADIYFDYNFPIRTNEAQTTVALPSFTQDWVSDINVYPNPVSDILFLQTEDTWTKAEIFDVAGRIMRAASLSSLYIDVSTLESGTYFVRLRNGDRVGRVKFVKM